MLYHLLEYIKEAYNVPWLRLMDYISFRALVCGIAAIVIALCCGMPLIRKLKGKNTLEEQRELGISGEEFKKNVPSMGGLLIIFSVLVPILLFGDLTSLFNQLLIFTTLWLGLIGFLDDYLKIHGREIREKGSGILFRLSSKPTSPLDKGGISGCWKIAGQASLGLVVGLTVCLHPDLASADSIPTTIPFVKGHELDYASLIPGDSPLSRIFEVLLYTVIITFIVTAVSNGANLTDGKDGLCAGTTAIVGATLGVLAYLSGNTIYATYLNIMYIPSAGEVTIYMSALTGALLGFLWYNSYPAQIFMGDTGSLCLGGIIGVTSVLIKKELLLPILCGIFLVEALSVIIQRYYFKYTKRKYGQGRRIFRMSPLHHHFEKNGIEAVITHPTAVHHEVKIVTRFLLTGLILAALTIITLKIR